MIRPLLFALILAAPAVAQARALAGERAEARAAIEEAREGAHDAHWVQVRWDAPELADSLGDTGHAQVGLALPRHEVECLTQAAKCWLVIYLSGFDSTLESFQQSLEPTLDALDAKGAGAPFVVVVVDGRNALGGGWYVDSAATGHWQSFVLNVLLPAAREALAPGTPPERTLIMGHSMGGFGALRLALARPELFHAVAAFNPAARTTSMAQGVLKVLESRGAPPDVDARLAHRDTSHFYERVLLSLGGALFPDAKSPHGLAPLFDAKSSPWRLTLAAQAAFDAQDLTPEKLVALKLPLRIYAGKRDHLVPLAELRPYASHATLLITDGDHLSHLAADLQDALTQLAH